MSRFLVVEAIESSRSGSFVGEINDRGRGRLHAVGKLVRSNAGLQRIIILASRAVRFVQRANVIELAALPRGGDFRRRAEVEDRRRAVAKLRALIYGWHEASAPVAAATWRFIRIIEQHDKSRQLFRFGTKSVVRPSA